MSTEIRNNQTIKVRIANSSEYAERNNQTIKERIANANEYIHGDEDKSINDDEESHPPNPWQDQDDIPDKENQDDQIIHQWMLRYKAINIKIKLKEGSRELKWGWWYPSMMMKKIHPPNPWQWISGWIMTPMGMLWNIKKQKCIVHNSNCFESNIEFHRIPDKIRMKLITQDDEIHQWWWRKAIHQFPYNEHQDEIPDRQKFRMKSLTEDQDKIPDRRSGRNFKRSNEEDYNDSSIDKEQMLTWKESVNSWRE